MVHKLNLGDGDCKTDMLMNGLGIDFDLSNSDPNSHILRRTPVRPIGLCGKRMKTFPSEASRFILIVSSRLYNKRLEPLAMNGLLVSRARYNTSIQTHSSSVLLESFHKRTQEELAKVKHAAHLYRRPKCFIHLCHKS